MRTLILAAGRFGPAMREAIRHGREPRLDVFEIADHLGADVLDFLDVERSPSRRVRLVTKALGPSAALAYLGYRRRNDYDAVLTSGEDIGIPLASLLQTGTAACSHTMIAHTLFPRKKRVFFQYLRVQRRIDRILAYSSSEERLLKETLGIPPQKVERIYYHADDQFFRPGQQVPEPTLICAAGQLLRDYDCLLEAVRGLDVRVEIAAGSPWIEQPLRPGKELPPNVTWGKRSRFELRNLYERAAVAVVPILQNEYQTGIATILEMMAMGKCVIATRTHGQTDTIVDGETGIYVPPGAPHALRRAIEERLAAPESTRRIGAAARRFVVEHASLDRFVDKIAEAVQLGHQARLAA